MTRQRGWVSIVVFFAIAFAARPAARQQARFTAKITAVAVNVFVRNGTVPVAALASPAFVLTDNGVPQTVEVEGVESLPLDLTLALDMSGSSEAAIEGFKDDVRSIAKLLRPVDRVRLLTFDTEVHEVFPFEAATAKLPLDRLKGGSFTSLLDGLIFSLVHAVNPERQHLIVVFTDGGENVSLVNGKTVVDAATHSDGLLEIVLTANQDLVGTGRTRNSGAPVPGQAAMPAPVSASSLWLPILRAVAEATGGEVHTADKSSSLKKTFDGLFADIRRSYVLRYTPTGVAAADWHDIVVTVPGHPEDAQVRARKGYFGG